MDNDVTTVPCKNPRCPVQPVPITWIHPGGFCNSCCVLFMLDCEICDQELDDEID